MSFLGVTYLKHNAVEHEIIMATFANKSITLRLSYTKFFAEVLTLNYKMDFKILL